MKIPKRLFFQILLFHSSIFPFRFFFDQKITYDFFWHLKMLNVPNLPFQSENYKKSVRVAILDTFFSENSKSMNFYRDDVFRLATNFNLESNLSEDRSNSEVDENVVNSKERSLNLKVDVRFSGDLLKKNHGACVASFIRQIAPEVQIISIPIFNDQGITNIQNFIQKLRHALNQKIDILYIGLKIEEDNITFHEKEEILKLLSQFLYVVAPSGNDGLSSSNIAFPANSIFFSVGAFEQKNNQYVICDFSQKQIKKGPNFVMPGKNNGCFIWNDQLQKMEPCLVSGTSIAAACMVGCLALILSETGSNFTAQQIQYVVQKNSQKLHKTKWDQQVNFGVINISESLFCIQQLKVFQNQMSVQKFQKKFQKLVNKIVEKIGDS